MTYTDAYRKGRRDGLLTGLLIAVLSSLFTYAVFGQSPALELQAAAVDSGRQDSRYYRYVTAYNLPLDSRKVGDFVVNSVSQRRRISPMRRITDTLYRVDTRDYGWDLQAWEALIVDPKRPSVRVEPYFEHRGLPADAEYALRLNTGSYGAIVRLDYFVAKVTLEPHYSQFLGLGDKLADVEKQFYVQREGVQKLGLAQGGAVLNSIVALHNRQLERWPTITGYWWQSRDTRTNRKTQNVLENIFAIEHDAGEFIWSLPNGLQGYYLANAAGKQQIEVPPDIAIDSRTTLRDKRVRNASNCISCHDVGINPISDVISKLIRSGATYATKNKDEALALEEYYLSDLAAQIQRDNAQYAAAVLTCNGLTPEANATAYQQLVGTYLEGRITLEIASRETGYSVDQLRAIAPKLYSGTFNALLAGEEVARDAWDEIFWRVMVCGHL